MGEEKSDKKKAKIKGGKRKPWYKDKDMMNSPGIALTFKIWADTSVLKHS